MEFQLHVTFGTTEGNGTKKNYNDVGESVPPRSYKKDFSRDYILKKILQSS